MLKFFIILPLILQGGIVEDYREAESLLSKGLYGDARKAYEELIRNYRDSGYLSEFRFKIAETYIMEGKPQRAIHILRKLLEDEQGKYMEPEILVALGYCYLQVNNLKGVRFVLENLARFPVYEGDERVLLLKGALFYRNRTYEDAERILGSVFLPEGYLLQARTEARLGNLPDAIVASRTGYEKASSFILKGFLSFLESEALFLYGDYKGAILRAKRFVKEYGEHPLALYGQFILGVSHFKLGQDGEALDILSSLVDKPDFILSPEVSYYCGLSALSLGKYEDALKYFQKVRTYSAGRPLSIFAAFQMARAYHRMGKRNEVFLMASQFESFPISKVWEGIGNYLAGILYLDIGQLEDAEDKLLQVVEKYPYSRFKEPALALVLYACNLENDWDRTVALGHVFLEDISGSNSFWAGLFKLNLAEALYYTGNVTDAERLYAEIFQSYKLRRLLGSAEMGLAWTYLAEGREDEASSLFEALAGVASDDTTFLLQTHLGLGISEFNRGNFENALREFHSLELSFPELTEYLPDILYWKGLTLYAMKYYGDAVKVWEGVMSYYPESKRSQDAAFRTGETYYRAGEYDKAIATLNWLLEHHPDSPWIPRAYFLIGMCHYSQKNYAEALSTFETFVERFQDDPLIPEVKKRIEYTLYAMSVSSPEYIETFEKRFPRSPLAAEAMFYRAAKLYEDKKLEEAAEVFFKMALGHPDHEKAPEALIYAGQIYSSLGRWSDAALAYKKMVDFFPNHKDRAKALLGLGTAYYNLEMYNEAKDAFKTVVESYPESEVFKAALKNLGLTYLKLERMDGASQALRRAALLFEEEGEKEEALRLYRYLLQIAPDPETRRFAEEKVKRISGEDKGKE
jgi:TolA-binding protein